MDRLLNGAIAWLFFLLAVMVALAVASRKESGGVADGDGQGAFAAPLTMVNPPSPSPEPQGDEPTPPNPTLPVRPNRHAGRAVTTIIVHHSASAHGNVATIGQWHRERGWDGVGYHYVICNGNGGGDGEVQAGREENVHGAHARGRNHDSLGVCLIGNDDFSPAQLRSLRRLLQHLCRRHGITPSLAAIQRHHDRCPGPGLNLEAIIWELARE